MSDETRHRIDELERLEATSTLAALARDLARDLSALIGGARLAVARGHGERCPSVQFIPGCDVYMTCTCGFDELREALKDIEP